MFLPKPQHRSSMSSKGGGTALSRRNYRLASDTEKPKATGELHLLSDAMLSHTDPKNIMVKQPYL